MNEPASTPGTFHENDVLCGKGNFVNMHPGNRQFRSLVDGMKNEYVAAPKKQKPLFAKMVLSEIRAMDPPGRFLTKNKSTGLWEHIEEKKARIKARQALREGAPAIEKMMKDGKIEVTTVCCMLLLTVLDHEYRTTVYVEPETGRMDCKR